MYPSELEPVKTDSSAPNSWPIGDLSISLLQFIGITAS